MTIKADSFDGVWSAMSTPLTEDYAVDADALERLVEHQIRLGIRGLFLAGTAGEGFSGIVKEICVKLSEFQMPLDNLSDTDNTVLGGNIGAL